MSITQSSVNNYLNFPISNCERLNNLIKDAKTEIGYLGSKYLVIKGSDKKNVYLDFEKVLQRTSDFILYSEFFYNDQERQDGKALKTTLESLNKTLNQKVKKTNFFSRSFVNLTSLSNIPFSRLDKYTDYEFRSKFPQIPLPTKDPVSLKLSFDVYSEPSLRNIRQVKDRIITNHSDPTPPASKTSFKRRLLSSTIALATFAPAASYFYIDKTDFMTERNKTFYNTIALITLVTSTINLTTTILSHPIFWSTKETTIKPSVKHDYGIISKIVLKKHYFLGILPTSIDLRRVAR